MNVVTVRFNAWALDRVPGLKPGLWGKVPSLRLGLRGKVPSLKLGL